MSLFTNKKLGKIKKIILILLIFAIPSIVYLQFQKTESEDSFSAPIFEMSPSVVPIKNIIYSESTRYYQIAGDSELDLREEMDAKRLECYGGTAYDACTGWYIKWYIPTESVNDSCDGPIKVEVDVVFSYPQWDFQNNSSQDLREKWDKYILALELHENGHKENAIEGGEELWLVLNNLSNEYNCEDLSYVADEKGSEILEKVRGKDISYDDKTDHGESQGAVFP